ncbi:hypothetical protein Q5L94_13935, partial [Idiomarina sp. Sol25]|uniref:hypothetical protein n=1 Tax=Idiomarina sp. Sol25 TaxID=3064000 RepID=UPI00294F4E9F|nr:hypothetical protein [Idiomarina sp. Sol25]
GEFSPMVSPQEALAYPYTPSEKAAVAANPPQLLVGAPATVRGKIDALIAATRADEVMIMTAMFDQTARLRSYALLAQAYGLAEA